MIGMQLVVFETDIFKAKLLMIIKGKMMRLIVFIHQDASSKGEIFKKVIDKNFKGLKVLSLHTFNALKARLKKGSGFIEEEILILFAESRNRLYELASLIDLLEGKRIILILPDESKATLSETSRFFPRFFTPISETYDDLCDVLNKMINQGK
jgi:hypothetical protein